MTIELIGIEEQPVDGKVAALDVFFSAEGIANLVWMAAVRVGSVGAEGGYFCEGGLAFDFSRNQDHAEVGSYGEGAREEIEDNVRRGGGGYVVVFGFAAKQEVAHASTGEVGLVAFLAELAQDGACGGELGAGGELHISIVASIVAPELVAVSEDICAGVTIVEQSVSAELSTFLRVQETRGRFTKQLPS